MEVEAPPPASVDEALHELHVRFLNLPRGEETVARIFFQLQQAHWFYEDEWADYDYGLPHLRFDEFSRRMFEQSPMLRDYCMLHADFKAQFKEYMASIPKYGCILMNSSMTHMLLVCGIGSKNYSFPKGKVNQGEAGIDCAAREAYEETGFDPRHLLAESASLSVAEEGGGFLQLYIAVGVPDDGSVSFAPLTKKEVGGIAWVEVDTVDTRKHVGYCPGGGVSGEEYGKTRLWRVSEFMGGLQAFIQRRRNEAKAGSKKKRKPAQALHHQQHQSGYESRGVGYESRGSAGRGYASASGQAKPRQQQQQQQRQQQPHLLQPTSSGLGGPSLLDMPLEGGGNASSSSSKAKGWSVDDMFAANASLRGVTYVYDGNPHTFGDDTYDAVPVPDRIYAMPKEGAGAGGGVAASASKPRHEPSSTSAPAEPRHHHHGHHHTVAPTSPATHQQQQSQPVPASAESERGKKTRRQRLKANKASHQRHDSDDGGATGAGRPRAVSTDMSSADDQRAGTAGDGAGTSRYHGHHGRDRGLGSENHAAAAAASAAAASPSSHAHVPLVSMPMAVREPFRLDRRDVLAALGLGL